MRGFAAITAAFERNGKMGFNKRFYAMAEEELARRRADNERATAKRRKEISDKYPAARKYLTALAKTSSKLITLIIDCPREEFSARLAELERENLDIQSKLDGFLRANGYPDSYLNEIHTCNICGDTGNDGQRRCKCYKDIVKRLAAAELCKSSPMSLCGFDTFDLSFYDDRIEAQTHRSSREIMDNNLFFCKKYAGDFHLPYDSLLLRGKTGLGKTHLSLSIAGEVIEKGYSVVYGSAPDLFRKVEQEHFGRDNDDETMNLLQGADLLILDDLGAEFDSQFYVSVVYNLINSRLNAGKPTIVSTNLDAAELTKRYGERVTSRLFTMEQLLFVGNDIRKQKKIKGIQ